MSQNATRCTPAPRVRTGATTRFAVADQKGYLTTAVAADGALDAVTIRGGKQGSTLAGVMDALGEAITVGLRTGAPTEDYVAELVGIRELSGH
jgi:hypothetical protein